ncbi:MAG TPA: hypothetical protein VFK85_03710 [Anaeromyxobacteraceae bacterium]|nr:hypothetical protein [Anaeromyxobacteraceae bacterium]
MRMVGAVLLIAVLGGCTSVKMVQRDGCWIRRTEKRGLGTVTEEVGPCARPNTAFVENDSLTRMVQECIARADYRWQMRALAAWDRREPWPEQLSETSVLQQCMNDSARGVLGEAGALKEKNAALEQRLAEATKAQQQLEQRSDEDRKELARRIDEERKDLIRRSDEERNALLALQGKLGDHLGEAAKKVQPVPAPAPAVATATATSEGRSRSEQASDSQGQPATLAFLAAPGTSVPAACVVEPQSTTTTADAPRKASKPIRQARAPRRATETRKAPAATSNLPACDPAKTPGQANASGVKPGEAGAATSFTPEHAVEATPVPAGQTPAGQTPAGQTPAGQTPAGQTNATATTSAAAANFAEAPAEARPAAASASPSTAHVADAARADPAREDAAAR